jgi:hypothetical protein
VPNPGLVGTIAYCLVVGQAAVPLDSLVVSPAYEGIIISEAQHDRRDAASAWAPGEPEVREAERDLPASIRSSEAGAVSKGSRIGAELANYKRQYWGVVRNGQRETLSFIHRASPLGETGQWKTTAVLLEGGGYPSSSGVVVQGGGERYFRVTYSLDFKRFSQLQINSPI